MMAIKIIGVVVAVSLLTGCCSGLDAEIIRDKLTKELHVGDSREKVERVLKSHGMDFSYDAEFEQRYQSLIGGEDCAFNPLNKVVAVYIYMNKSGRVSKIEVSNSYTFL